MKIMSLGAELPYADRQTERQTKLKKPFEFYKGTSESGAWGGVVVKALRY
jgi:hypothetical protein